MAPKCTRQIASFHRLEKGESDPNDYCGLVLNNGLKVIVVSNPTTVKSAAVLSVRVGTMSNPKEIPGLAHFIEHLFLFGPKKLRDDSHYSRFLAQHSGHSNGRTTADDTKHYFDIMSEQFEEALEIFSEFFHTPSFDQEIIDRELKLVNHENADNLKDDARRIQMVEMATVNQQHDYSKFGTGNYETLRTNLETKGIDLRDAVYEFLDKWYSSNIMSACLYGKESVDDLMDIAVNVFGKIPNKNVTAPEWPDTPFTDRELGVQIKIVPIMDVRMMELCFAIPDIRKHVRTFPCAYINYLVGHQGEGSLLSHLKRRGWVTSIASEGLRPARGFGLFKIGMELTVDGSEHTDEIAAAVFGYLELLRRQREKHRCVFEEIRDYGRTNFRFKPNEEPLAHVRRLVNNLNDYDWEDVLSAGYMIHDHTTEQIMDVLEYLVPDKVRITLVSQAFVDEATQTELYYSTPYVVEKIPDTTIARWRQALPMSEMHLPNANEFIPTDFSLVANEDDSSKPRPIITEPHTRLWYLHDKVFKMPLNVAKFGFISNEQTINAECFCYTELALRCFRDAHAEYFYPAEIANCCYNVQTKPEGFILTITGYHEHQQRLLEQFCHRLVNLTINPVRFEVFKEEFLREMANYECQQPFEQVTSDLSDILKQKMWNDDLLPIVTGENFTARHCQIAFRKFLEKLYVKGLIYGNISEHDAHRMGATIHEIINYKPCSPRGTYTIGDYSLSHATTYQFRRETDVHERSATYVFYQIGTVMTDETTAALNDVFSQIMSELSFEELRLSEQLGYLVWGGCAETASSFGFRILIQSPDDPLFVSVRIDSFINDFMDRYLKEMSPEEFEKHKRSTVVRLREQFNDLDSKAEFLFREIWRGTFYYDRVDHKAVEVSQLTKESLLHFFNTHIARDGYAKRQLIVIVNSMLADHATGHGDGGEAGVQPREDIVNIEVFRAQHGELAAD